MVEEQDYRATGDPPEVGAIYAQGDPPPDPGGSEPPSDEDPPPDGDPPPDDGQPTTIEGDPPPH
jgi:hypothetical protein